MARSLLTIRIVSIALTVLAVFYFVRDFQSRIYLHRAGSAADQQDWDATGEFANRSLRLNKATGYAWYYRGVSQAAKGDHVKGREDLTKAAHLMNNPSLARLTLSGVLYQAGEHADAAALLEKALAMNPYPELNPVRNWQIMADLYGKTGKAYAAIPALWMTAIAGKMSGELLLPIAEQYRALDHDAPAFPDALAQYFAWVYKPDAVLKGWIISHYDNQKRPDLVVAFLENLIARNAAEPKDHLGLALSYNESKQPKEALEVLEKVSVEFSGEPLYHYARGQAAEQLGDAATMREAYSRYLQLSPNASDRAEIEAKIR